MRCRDPIIFRCPDENKFGKWVLAIRKHHKLTALAVSAESGLSQSRIQGAEQRYKRQSGNHITLRTARLLLDVYGLALCVIPKDDYNLPLISKPNRVPGKLSERQFAIANYYARGFSSEQIAEYLDIHRDTVTHILAEPNVRLGLFRLQWDLYQETISMFRVRQADALDKQIEIERQKRVAADYKMAQRKTRRKR